MAFPNSYIVLVISTKSLLRSLESCVSIGGGLRNLLLYYILLIYFCVTGDWILQRKGFTTELQFPLSNCLIFKEQNCSGAALS